MPHNIEDIIERAFEQAFSKAFDQTLQNKAEQLFKKRSRTVRRWPRS
jgi:hypothetical protein